MKNRIFVIGASLSGIDALCRLVQNLPKDFPAPILITQHVASHSPGMLPEILSKAGPLHATHPKSGEQLQPGRIYVAPPDRHMLVRDNHILLSHGPRENLSRPAIDPMFRSAAVAYGPAAVGVVLTGQLDDGTAGLLAIKDRGGVAIVQEPSEATAASMPKSALRHVPIDYRCKLIEMADIFLRLAKDAPGDEPKDARKLMDVENRIAEGIFSVEDWWVLDQMSVPSGFNCPDCRSAVYELKDTRVIRFRCRSGHAYSAKSLLSGQADARETLLSSVFGALIEELTLAKRMQADTPYSDEFADGLIGRVSELENEATRVCDWLHAMTGLVQPEPEPPPRL